MSKPGRWRFLLPGINHKPGKTTEQNAGLRAPWGREPPLQRRARMAIVAMGRNFQ